VSKTVYVEFRGEGFWADDVALSVLLKHLIDVAGPKVLAPGGGWLSKAILDWRVATVVGDIGLCIRRGWTSRQLDQFVNLVEVACAVLEVRQIISGDEVAGWTILDGESVQLRGAGEVDTRSIVHLGQAVIALVRGSLAPAPAGRSWLYGTGKAPELL
jgi:hypothetical protein